MSEFEELSKKRLAREITGSAGAEESLPSEV